MDGFTTNRFRPAAAYLGLVLLDRVASLLFLLERLDAAEDFWIIFYFWIFQL
jgi:hypothetical protein